MQVDYQSVRFLGHRIEKHIRPIHYENKKMTEAETNYTTTEKEMLAVVYAFEKFRSYLIMNKSVVYTKPTAHFRFEIPIPTKRRQSKIELRWVLPLQNLILRLLILRELKTDAADTSLIMSKYGVTHRLFDPYHRSTVVQVEVTNRGLKRILERTVGENRASWSDKLDDALWAFRTAYKTPIGCTPYKLVYGKACHLPLENSLIYKEKTKKLHDSKIKNRIFNVGDQVLLFNSRLKIFSGKLKSRWSGPFTITEVYPYGTAKLSHADGSNFKVNCHRLKHYYGGDAPPLVIPDLQTFPKDN
ncbi:reverse transcriptase domain-containing protein [Tanacetum coccineum]